MEEKIWNSSERKKIKRSQTSNYKTIVERDILNELVSVPCPFPEWKEYKEIRENLSPVDQKKMQENIGNKDKQGKIEIIKMKSKFSILVPKNIDNEDIFDGGYKDGEWQTGLEWINYLTWAWAEKEIITQGKNLLEDSKEVEYFFSLFPWKTTEEQIDNFVKLFNLKKTGFFSKLRNKWYDVGSLWYVKMSKLESPRFPQYGTNEKLIRQIVFGGKRSQMESLVNPEYPMQYVVKEPIL